MSEKNIHRAKASGLVGCESSGVFFLQSLRNLYKQKDQSGNFKRTFIIIFNNTYILSAWILYLKLFMNTHTLQYFHGHMLRMWCIDCMHVYVHICGFFLKIWKIQLTVIISKERVNSKKIKGTFTFYLIYFSFFEIFLKWVCICVS